jgi:hypothetical protein
MVVRLTMVAGVAALIPLGEARAQTATQVVRFEVTAINQIGVSGSAAPLVINSATAGSAPASVVSSGGSYAVTTNEANKKITASVDQALPSGVTLEVSLAAPSGAASSNYVPLGLSSSDVVTGISSLTASSLPINYRLSATPAVFMGAQTRTVTFTIVSGT